jgi:prepilin-type processing-associated H-X9-DG protein
MAGNQPNVPSQFGFNSDMPGMYHNRSATFAFADGHASMQHWLDLRTTPPLQPPGPGAGGSSGPAVPTLEAPHDEDVAWLQVHSVTAIR